MVTLALSAKTGKGKGKNTMTSKKSAKANAKMTDPANDTSKVKTTAVGRAELLRAAIAEADALGWDMMTMRDIALAANVSLADVQAHFIDKFDVLVAFGRHIDHETLKSLGSADESLTPREKLFEGLMARFDVMQQYRGIIAGLADTAIKEPKQVLFSVPELARSMGWLLEQGGFETSGLRGLGRIAGLTAVYLAAFRVWLKDDSADLARTMAAVDKGLTRAESLANRFEM